jgi:hypothetical protein
MRSHEVLKQAFSTAGVKAVAAELGVSESLVYKWCEEAPDDENLGSGARNPLDRVLHLYRITSDPEVLGWLCRQAGGFFTPNSKGASPETVGREVFQNTQSMIKDFSDVLDEVSRAVADGKGVNAQEAKRIRREWEELKRRAESFVMGCEKGMFDEQ